MNMYAWHYCGNSVSQKNVFLIIGTNVNNNYVYVVIILDIVPGIQVLV